MAQTVTLWFETFQTLSKSLGWRIATFASQQFPKVVLRMLKPLLGRLAAVLLTFHVYLVMAHVESTENPTDYANRW